MADSGNFDIFKRIFLLLIWQNMGFELLVIRGHKYIMIVYRVMHSIIELYIKHHRFNSHVMTTLSGVKSTGGYSIVEIV